MANIFHSIYTVTQPYADTEFDSEPAITLNGVYYPNFHRGVDLVGPSANCPVYAAVPGKVYGCGRDNYDGANFVIELGDDGYWYLYWHFLRVDVFHGQRIDNNTQLGLQGKTGNADGEHVHFERDEPQPWPGHTLQLTPTDPTSVIGDQPQGGANDMTFDQKKEIVRSAYRVLGDGFIAQEDVITDKANQIGDDGNVDVVFSDVRNSVPWIDPQAAQAKVDAAVKPVQDELNTLKQQNDGSNSNSVNEIQQLASQLAASQEALQACQKASTTPEQIDCQQRVDQAVSIALEKAEADANADPFKHLAAWLGQKLHTNTKGSQ